MNEASQIQRPAVWPMYRSLVGIGVLCAVLIVLVFDGTRPIIARNRAEALERAVFTVLPDATRRVTFTLVDDRGFEPVTNGDGARIHAGFDADDRLVGVAVEANGMGYADTISLLYGYSPAAETIIGMQVLTSKETPGLGDKIQTDKDFLANFAALDVRLDETGTALRHPVETVKQGKKSEPWQIDGITGATISSEAIGEILANSSAYWVPLIRRRIGDLQTGVMNAAP